MSERWKKAVDIKNYLAAYENNAIRNGNLTEEKIKWLIWARKKADWYDPEIELEDELLKGVDRNEVHNPKSNNPGFIWQY